MSFPNPYLSDSDMYRLLLEEAGQGIFILNQNDEITYINRKSAELLRRPPQEIIGHKLSDFTDTEDAVIVNTALQRRHSGLGGEYAFRLKTDGGHRWVLATAKPLMDKDGKYQGSFEMLLDISPIKEIESELRKEIAKSEIYADLMGHDLFNQLQIALGQLEMLDEKVDESNRPGVRKAIEALLNSTMLIEKFKNLYYVKTEVPASVPIDVGQAVSDAIKEFSQVTGMQLNINYTPVRGCKVQANRLLKDLFSGLIGHVIKHATQEVEIRIRQDEVNIKGKEYCRVAIEDNGPGISPEEKKYLFEQFGMEGVKAKGMGFSFYFIKLLIEDFEGTISVDDRVPGDYAKGSRFTVMFPKVEVKNA